MANTQSVITFSPVQPGEDCSATIQQLLDAERCTIEFPAGEYHLGAGLRLPSGTHFKADPQAIFRLADGAMQTHDDYLLTNADHSGGNADIVIEGGVWDGNQHGNPRPEGLFDDGYTGAMFHFENVKGIRLVNATLRNAEAYYARFTQVDGIQIEDIFFDSDHVRKNNDGIHLGGGCFNAVIRRLRATTPGVCGDDMVALNADDALNRTEVRGMQNGPIENIEIEDIEAHSCHTFVRLLSVTSPIRNVRIRKLRGGCHVAAVNGDGARHCRVPVFDEANPPYADGVGLLENIDIADVIVHKAGENQKALIDIQERMRNFVVSGFTRDQSQDQSPDTPTLRFRYIELTHCEIDGQSFPAQNLLDGSVFEQSPARIERLSAETSVKG